MQSIAPYVVEALAEYRRDINIVLTRAVRQLFAIALADYEKVQRIIMENAFVCPLAFQVELVAMNKRVRDYKPNLLGKPKYDDVWLAS